jgi:hypothetical protein
MIGIEASQEILVRLPGAARMLNGDETGDQTQNLGGATLGLEEDIFVRNELFR